MEYNAWPLGAVPREFQRNELYQLQDSGYKFDNPRDIVTLFENKIAEYAGSKYAVAVDSCTNAIFLCLKYLNKPTIVTVPSRTWLSVPMSVLHAGYSVRFEDFKWDGVYQLDPLSVYDSAVRFTKDMYIPGSYYCLSFQFKKRLPIGKGGMVLTDDKDAADWIRCASYEGRHIESAYENDSVDFLGWNMYMTPEDASRGIIIFDQLPDINENSCCQDDYRDISTHKVFNNG